MDRNKIETYFEDAVSLTDEQLKNLKDKLSKSDFAELVEEEMIHEHE